MQVKVVYVINGTTKKDTLVGSDISVQRDGDSVHVEFPRADGAYLTDMSRLPTPRPPGLMWVSYAKCDKVDRFLIEEDVPTDLS